jgi:hypothetical protein
MQPRKQHVELQFPAFSRHTQHLGSARRPRRDAIGMHEESQCSAVAEHATACVDPRRRVEHDAHGILTFDVPHGQLRIVARNRARTDDDRVRERAQAVQMANVVGPGYVVRVARRGRDEAVEALAEMRESQRLCGTSRA